MKIGGYSHSTGPAIGKQLTRYLLEVLALGFLLGVIATVVTSTFSGWVHNAMLIVYSSHPGVFNFGTARAFVFMVLGDVAITPVYLVRVLRLLKYFRMKKNTTFKQIIWLTSCFFVMVPGSIIAPYGLLADGNAYSWRVKFAYDALTVYPGLALLGGCFLWVSAIFIAAAIHFLPLMWFQQQQENKP